MAGIPGPFGGSSDRAAEFDGYDAFVPEHLPGPGAFLADGEVLTGDDHAAFHRLTRALFEERGVYDVTFGYNLARLNLDPRHPGAGYRYARESGNAGEAGESGDEAVLRAEFTPTTPFCPQSDALTRGSFRAWNGLADRHEYDVVRVRADESHHRHTAINRALERLERQFRETGVVPGRAGTGTSESGGATGEGGVSDGDGVTGYDAPF